MIALGQRAANLIDIIIKELKIIAQKLFALKSGCSVSCNS